MKIKSLLKHNLMRAAMTLALILTCATAWAQTKQSVTYIDENGQTQTVDATLLTASTYSTNMSGWYVASGTFTNYNRLAVNYDYATLNLILADDCHLTMTKGLQVPSHATLNIYSQSKGSSMGKLTITTPDTRNAGIGGSNKMTQSIPSGNINIYGGDLNITGGSSGAGIGGGLQAAAQGAILITNGAKVVATGGSGGAGIGGGYQASFSSITITGNATVTASATNGGEAIGRGQGASQSGTLSITNSTVNNVHYDADGFQDGSTHTVTFNSQGGTAVAAQTVGLKYGQTIVKANEPTVPTRTYYVFGGWYKESNCTNAWDFDNDAVTEDITLYAKWTPDPDHFSVSDDGNTYTIHTATGWGLFCDALQDNDTYNRFSGDTVKLANNITVTRMAGSNQRDFCGTFDGQGHTLTVAYGSAESPITDPKAAPFVNVESGCIIENLHVAGDIYTSGKNAAGIAGTQFGAVTIRNCRVSTAIHSYTIGDDDDGTHGGLVGNNGNGNGSALNIEGCVFDGKLLTEGATATIKCGGFVGWRHKEVTISNSLFAPTEVTIGTTSSATFARNGATITNCYYTTDFNDGEHFTAQGKQARSITAEDDYVTVENAEAATTYSTSGITSYGTGILYDNVLYAGNGDVVRLTLSNSIGGDVPEGYQYAYSTNAGTLEGSTLTMPDANVIVSVSTALRSTGQPVSITYNYYGGYNRTHDAIALDGTESSLGESGQETWYFVGTDISHSGTITCSGNVNIILADGKTMTITSSDGHGIDVNNFLTIYGQELGTGTLNAIINNSIGIYSYTGNITIRGGQVTATMSGSFGDGINTRYGSVTIYGGQVTATGNTTPGNSGICAFTGSVTINGGQVTATGSSGIYTDSGSVTINGGQVTANGNFSGIQANGSVTINGGQVTATGDVGIFTQSGGSVTINGGQVSAIGNNYGICAEDSNNITLGWTTASDYIYANTYYADYDYAEGTLSIAEGKAFIDEDGNIYSGTIAQVDQAYAIDGKTLYPYIEGSVPYIDENGQRQLCTDYNVLNGTETSLGTSGQETWYVADGTLNYGQTITISGNVHLILKDNAVMNVGTQSTITYGIGDGSSTASISIYGQSTGNSQGQLHVNVSAVGIFAKDGNLTINGGEVVVTSSYSLGIFANGGNITINGGEVEATGNNTNGEGIFATKNSSGNGGSISISNATVTANGSIGIQANSGITINSGTVTTNNCNYGIYASSCSLTINGGQVTANGSTYGIYAEGGNVTISGGQVTANGSTYDIYATYGNITISGGQVTANGSTYGIYAEGGNVNISGGEVEATGNNTNGNGGGILAIKRNGNGGNISISNATVTATGYIGIRAQSGITINSGTVTANNCNYGIYADVSNLTISGGQVTANGNTCGIFGDNITITSGEVTANGPYGIYVNNGNLIISGGQVTANGSTCGIWSEGDLTLGWTNATDFIYVSRYHIGTPGTLNIAEGKTFIDEAGYTYSSGTVNASAIAGKTLYPDCVVMKHITGYGNSTESDHWVFIASPVAESIAPSEVHNIFPSAGETSNEYDLYRFNQSSSNGKEWQNWKATTTENHPDFTSLVNGQGYLYATKETRTLVFAGEFRATTEPVEVPLDYVEGKPFAGWNLVGNPFADTAFVDPEIFYVMNDGGSEIIASQRPDSHVEPQEGIIVYAEEEGDTVTFTPNTRSKGHIQKPEPEQIVLNLSTLNAQRSTSIIDRAIVRFDESRQLPKFQIRENSTKIYIPQDGKDYAIATSNGQGEMPLNFKAEENGTYTISVDVDNVEMGYLHLIDNMTGADVDLLTSPNYTFTAKTTDYESRFKLVFAVGSSTGSDTFAFISNGNIIVNGEGTLQVFDVLGHQLVTKQLSTLNSQLSTLNYKSGVYMLRLINGDKVRTQKIVVE